MAEAKDSLILNIWPQTIPLRWAVRSSQPTTRQEGSESGGQHHPEH